MECPLCYQEPGVYEAEGSGALHFEQHDNLDGDECPGSNEPVPEAD